MSVLKVVGEVLGILAKDVLIKVLISVGITVLIGGSILVPIIVLNVAQLFESTKGWATLLTGISALITFAVGATLTGIGVLLFVRGRRS